jgi:hypothetical protein
MKKFITIFALIIVLISCKKSELQLADPGSPTPVGALASVKGVEQFALGIWSKLFVGVNLMSHTMVLHSIMGDEQWSSVGNWGWRYVNQVDKITMPAPYNNVVPNVLNLSQPEQLKALNNLSATNGSQTNATIYEWNMAYYVNTQANFLLEAINNPALTFPATEKATLQAWAYWWKGFAYSRVGSMYLAGVVNNNLDGTTNPNYLTRQAIITEANANFDKAIALLTPIAANDAPYTTIMNYIIPSFNLTTAKITPAMWIRDINTLKARNMMVNKKVTEMTTTDWGTVKTLATAGLIQGDATFVMGMDPAGQNDLSAGLQQHPFQWNSYNMMPGWNYPSERWIQDFKPGDARFTNGLVALAPSAVEVNRSSRGIQFGTRYVLNTIEKGGYWTTDNKKGQTQFAGSWEENMLMLAEANIRTGAIEAGLAFVDQVRSATGANLAPTVGTNLTLAQAVEELRRERRIALFNRGVAFYDARRFGFTAKASAGGGRANANVLVPNNIIGVAPSSGWTLLPTFMDYNYLDYWDVPVSEFSYNVPAPGGPAIAN